MERQRLVSDGDSIGTAGSLSRASAAGDKRRWRKYGESSTLMVRLSHTYTHVNLQKCCTFIELQRL